jgi:hypothetical protein
MLYKAKLGEKMTENVTISKELMDTLVPKKLAAGEVIKQCATIRMLVISIYFVTLLAYILGQMSATIGKGATYAAMAVFLAVSGYVTYILYMTQKNVKYLQGKYVGDNGRR